MNFVSCFPIQTRHNIKSRSCLACVLIGECGSAFMGICERSELDTIFNIYFVFPLQSRAALVACRSSHSGVFYYLECVHVMR